MLHLQLLGEFALTDDAAPVTTVNTARLRALLAYLVLHRTAPIPRQRLAFLLYPDSSEEQARTNLRNLVYLLRKALPAAAQFLSTDAQTIQWRKDAPFTLDVEVFQLAVRNANSISSLREAVHLYHGDLLPGCYDDWILPLREQLRQSFSDLLERLILLLENQRDYGSARQYAEQLLRLDPLREETYRQLMRLHALGGDQSGALRVYHTCVAVLQRELDVEPGAETRVLFEQLQKPEALPVRVPSRPASSRSNNLPTPLTNFIGREQECGDLRHLLTTARLLTLTGTGGSGKTRLALQVAAAMSDRFADGVWFIDLAPVSDPELVISTVANVLSVPEQVERPWADTLAQHVQPKELLLIFDNCEQVLGACAPLIELLLHSAPYLHIIATSRERLNLADELVWQVPPLSLPEADLVTTDRLLRYDAVRLFVERATLALPTFTFNAQNAASIAQICRQLDGLPLAIELAAARIRVLTPQQIASRLHDAITLLTRGTSTHIPRHQTLRAALDWSHELLTGPEQTLFRRSAVFASGFTIEAAEAVCADPDQLPRDQMLDILSELIDQSLVTISAWEAGEQVRYRLLEPVRQYAQEWLLKSGELDTIRTRHLQFFLDLAETIRPKLLGSDQAIWLNQLEIEHDNLLAALTWAHGAEQRAESLLRLARALRQFWSVRSHLSLGRYWLEAALGTARTHSEILDLHYYAEALEAAGYLAWQQDDHVEARRYFEDSLTRYEALNDRARVAAAYGNLGALAWRQSDYVQAQALYAEALTRQRSLNDKNGIALTLNNLGILDYEQGRYASARERYTESLSLHQELSNHTQVAWAYNNLGNVAYVEGHYEQARELYEQSLALKRALGNRQEIAELETTLGILAVVRGDLQAARTLCEEGLTLSREVGARASLAYALTGLGLIARTQGELADAQAHYLESLLLSKELRNQLGLVTALEALGGIAVSRNKPRRAAQLLGAAQAILDAIGARPEPFDRILYEQDLNATRAQLDEAAFSALWTTGYSLTPDQAIHLALTDQD